MPLTSSIIDAKGRKTEVLEVGEGDPLVFLHGGGLVEGYDFLEQIGDRYHVVVPLIAGYGATELDPAPTSHEELTAHLVDVLDVLGIERFVLAGHSLGAWRAVAFAAAHPERVERLVLAAGPGMEVPGHPMANMGEHTLEERKHILTYDQSIWEGRIPEEPDEAFFAVRAREQGVMRGFAPAPYDSDLRDRLASLNPEMRTLVLWGEGDRLIPVAHAEAWTAALPHASLRVFPGAGHQLFHERPEAVEAIAGTAATDGVAR